MGDSTIGYPAPPGYEAEISANPETLGTPRPLIDTGAPPGGDAPPAVTGGRMDARPAKKELRMNRRVLVTQGTAANDDLAFLARSVIIDNNTGQWLFEAASRRYVPPGCFGAVLQFPSGCQVLSVQWQAPPSVTQPGGTAGSQALLIYCEDMLDPSPGVVAAISASTAAVVAGTHTPADGTANPTDAVDTESFTMVWTGSVWNRLGTPSGLTDANALSQGSAVGPYIFNGTSFDRQREGQLLGSQLQSAQPSTAALSETSGTTAAGVQITASVAGVATKTSYITGFDVTLTTGTAGVVTATVTGIANQLNYAVATPAAGSNTYSIRFPVPIPATAVNTSIVVTVPASGGAAAVNTVNTYGFTN